MHGSMLEQLAQSLRYDCRRSVVNGRRLAL